MSPTQVLVALNLGGCLLARGQQAEMPRFGVWHLVFSDHRHQVLLPEVATSPRRSLDVRLLREEVGNLVNGPGSQV